MFSHKNIRRVVTLAIAAAMSAVILTGCTNTAEPANSQELTDVVSGNTSTEVTTITEPTEPAESTAPATEPVTEPATEPATEPVTEPTTEPVTEPVTTPATEPVTEPATPADAADNTTNYTTDGVPRNTKGHLAAPVKPTASYKLPKNAQLDFTGDASTALTTELPDGCYWTPKGLYPNAYTDPAGNLWCNQTRESDPAHDDNRGEGYYDPSGDYHPSQAEIDHAAALNAADHENHVNPPSADGTSGMTQEELDALEALLNSLL